MPKFKYPAAWKNNERDLMRATEFISCPVCGLRKTREGTCGHCNCPGETRRIKELSRANLP